MSNNQERAYQTMNEVPSPRDLVKYSTRENADRLTNEYFKDVRLNRDAEQHSNPASSSRPQSPIIVGDNLATRVDRPTAPIDMSRSTQWPGSEVTNNTEAKANPIAEWILEQSQRGARSFDTVVPSCSDGAGEPKVQRRVSIEQLIADARRQGLTSDDVGLGA